jgi:predicted nucleic acid-binding protein
MELQEDAPRPRVRVIVDTCVWSQFLRRDRSISDPLAKDLARFIRDDAVQMLGPIRQELLSGAQPDERFELLRRYLRFYPNLPLDEEDDERAASYYNLLRQRGLQATATDLLICAAAVRHNLRLFTTDSDFAGYAHDIPIRLHRCRGMAR